MKESLELLSRAIHEWMPKNRPVSQAPAAAELEKILDISLGEEGCDQEALEEAIKAYLHYNPDVSQVDFFKLLYSGQNKHALLGDWITSLEQRHYAYLSSRAGCDLDGAGADSSSME